MRFPCADRQSPGRRTAAEAGVALRRAVRGLLRRADVLRVEGRARAGHGGALRRRRRRAVGRLCPASRRALGTAGAHRARPGHTRRRLARPGPAALGQGGALAASPRRRPRSGLRAASMPTACSNRTRRGGSIPSDFRRAVNGHDAVRLVPRRVPGVRLERSARPLDVRRRPHLHDRRRADQGRSHEHGGLARSAGAAARSQAARIRRPRAGLAQAEGRAEQVPAPPRARAARARARSSNARRAALPPRSENGCADRWRR